MLCLCLTCECSGRCACASTAFLCLWQKDPTTNLSCKAPCCITTNLYLAWAFESAAAMLLQLCSCPSVISCWGGKSRCASCNHTHSSLWLTSFLCLYLYILFYAGLRLQNCHQTYHCPLAGFLALPPSMTACTSISNFAKDFGLASCLASACRPQLVAIRIDL